MHPTKVLTYAQILGALHRPLSLYGPWPMHGSAPIFLYVCLPPETPRGFLTPGKQSGELN